MRAGRVIFLRLSPDASNLSHIIGTIFQDEVKHGDFIEWLRILIPEFNDIEVKKSNIDDSFDFFIYEKCEEKGHHIWLNTHSQTLVRCLEIDEIILVNKINGETKAKQLTKEDEINIAHVNCSSAKYFLKKLIEVATK